MCRNERRAHDAALFEAAAAAVALFEVACERSILKCKCEQRLKWNFERTTEILTQMTVDLVSAIRENLSRIENVLRIERAFDFAHHLEQLIAKLVAHIFGTRDTHAMLGGERTFELSHQCGSFVGDLAEFFEIAGAVHIEHRSHVQKSAGSMSVITRRQSERFHNRLQTTHVFG